MAQVVETDNEVHHVDGASKDGAESQKSGLEVESSPESAAFDIIAVHGLHGDRRRTWQSDEPSDDIWLESAFNDVGPVRIITYGYDSGEATGKAYTRQGIYEEAQTLLDGLLELRTPEFQAGKRPIAFVSHDIGGLIVKAAIVLSLRNLLKYGKILPSIRVLIFFGYPHRSRSGQDLEEQVFRLLSLRQGSYQRGHIFKLTKSLVEIIHEVNGAFIHTKMLIQAHVVNVFSSDSDPVKQVFDRFAAVLNVPFECRIESKESHINLTKPDKDGSQGVSTACNVDWNSGTFEDTVAETLRMVLFQASPLYPPLESRKLAQYSELNDLIATKSNRLLHVRCDSDTSIISQNIYDFLESSEKEGGHGLYFQFNFQDLRFNNIPAMIGTFIAQIGHASIRSLTGSIETSLNRLSQHGTWTSGDLYSCWERLRLLTDASDAFYVLGGFDQCDESRQWFLSQIDSTMRRTESRLKIVIVSTAGVNEDITSALSRFPADAYRAIKVESNTFLEPNAPVGTGFEVAMLLQEKPQYISCEPRIRSLMTACAADHDLCNIILHWLRSTKKPVDAIKEDLSKMTPPTPEMVCMTILKSVPQERQTWARILISWVLLAVRPLQAEEFCAVSKLALGLKANTRKESTPSLPNLQPDLAEINLWLAGIFTVVHNEIHLSHPSLHTLLESSSHRSGAIREWYQGENSSQPHLDILGICLLCLTIPTIQSSAQVPPSSDATQASAVALSEKCEPHQLPYAIEHWARHYKSVKAKGEEGVVAVKDGISKLLRDQSTRQRWQKIYDNLSNPFLRTSKLFQTPLPVAAHFGLDDLVEVFETGFGQERSLALVEAARNGHLTTVCRLLEHPTLSLTFDDPYLSRALMAAAATGDGDVIREFLKYLPKENPEARYPWLSNILCRVASLGLEEDLKAILDLGVKVISLNFPDNETPLHFAARRRNYAATKVLLDAGASVTVIREISGDTPLHTAASYGSHDVVRLLLENGAKQEAKDWDGWTPLQCACFWGHHAAVEVLLDHKMSQEYHDPVEPHWKQPLLFAARGGHVKVVDSLLRHNAGLLEKNADVNYVGDGSHSALIEAAKSNNIEIIKLLLDHKADIEKKEEAGSTGWQRTALQVAVCYNKKDTVKLLIEHGANLNVSDQEGWTAMWTAAHYGYAEIVRLLAEAKAVLDSRCNESEWTPLHVAYDQPDVVRILLEHGADVNKDSQSGTPLGLAVQHNQHEVVKLILSSKKSKPDLTLKSSQTALLDAVHNGYGEIVNLLLEAGVDVNLTNEANAPLIAVALSQNNEAMVRTILEFNPDLNIQDTEGHTVLHYISRDTPLTSVRLAVHAGAKLNTVDKKKNSPLSIAIRFSTLEVVEYLISKKADVNPSEGMDGPPLHIACQRGSFDMVKLLVQSGANTTFFSAGRFSTPIMAACLRSREDSNEERVKTIRLLLENGADAKLYGGMFGYAIVAGCLASSAVVVKLLLEVGATPGVEDSMGRKPVHLASYNSITTLNALDAGEEDFALKDKCGRVALHYAAVSGQLDLIEDVLTRSESAGVGIDEPDNDDWTPLLWAVRAAPMWIWEDRLSNHLDVVNFLLEKGANPEARGKGIHKDWLPQEVAIYHRALPSIVEAIESRVTPRRKSPGQHKRGQAEKTKFCDFCLLQPYGIYFDCLSCKDFLLCLKCYRSAADLHPGHDFLDHGYEWDRDDEAESVNSETFLADDIKENAAPENGFEEEDSDGVLGEVDDSLLDLMVRGLDVRRQRGDDVTSEDGIDDEVRNE